MCIICNLRTSDRRAGLAGKHQISNANLAVNLAASFLAAKDEVPAPDLATGLPQTYVDGLKGARWPGRCQRVADPKHPALTWFLDGAHTKESLECCMEWYVRPEQAFVAPASVSLPLDTHLRADTHIRNTLRVLVFNCTSGRSGKAFLSTMFTTVAAQLATYPPQSAITDLFDRVIFSTNVTYADGQFKGGASVPQHRATRAAHARTRRLGKGRAHGSGDPQDAA